jgi:predicted enzyme related to lactoylglutathione lyase
MRDLDGPRRCSLELSILARLDRHQGERRIDMSERTPLPGKFVWFEHVSRDAKKAQPFYGEVLGWKVQPFPMGADSYDMILAGETLDTMVGGYAAPRSDGQPSHWIAYVSIEDVDETARAAAANGGKVVEAPYDAPGVGRMARITDPQGAALCLFKSAQGDRPDAPAPRGHFFWNELHTTDPTGALTFYEKVVGFSHRSLDMGPGGTYHILSRGGVDRGGVTAHLPPGVAPHWLPYVAVDDVDGTIARARKLGATIPIPPEDIPGIGRFGVLQDPTGAVLAIMKPLPRER